ncbi:MAG: hypothetical protein IJR58_01625, partial [Lachnospiraceae bacterium]|nr:hypothetical protein [Lachnospiraceae bacterium]
MKSQNEEYLESLLQQMTQTAPKRDLATELNERFGPDAKRPKKPDTNQLLEDMLKESEDAAEKEIAELLQKSDAGIIVDESLRERAEQMEGLPDVAELPHFTVGADPDSVDLRDEEEKQIDMEIAAAEEVAEQAVEDTTLDLPLEGEVAAEPTEEVSDTPLDETVSAEPTGEVSDLPVMDEVPPVEEVTDIPTGSGSNLTPEEIAAMSAISVEPELSADEFVIPDVVDEVPDLPTMEGVSDIPVMDEVPDLPTMEETAPVEEVPVEEIDIDALMAAATESAEAITTDVPVEEIDIDAMMAAATESAEAATTDLPLEGEVSAEPTEEVSDLPVLDEVPDLPVMEEVPDLSTMEEASDIPVMDEVPDLPVMEELSELPTMEETAPVEEVPVEEIDIDAMMAAATESAE